MKKGIEIELHYRYCDLDKEHQYSVVCRKREGYGNDWVSWLWYRMGVAFGDREVLGFKLYPFANDWDSSSRKIKEYKTVNNGVDNVIGAIKKHYLKIKNK